MDIRINLNPSARPAVQLVFDTGKDDFELWLKLACLYSPSVKSFVQRNLQIAKIGGVFFVLFSIPFFFVRGYTDLAIYSMSAPWLFGLGIVLLLYRATLAPAFYRWAYRDAMRDFQKATLDPGAYGRYTVTATEDTLQLKKPTGYEEFALSDCSLPLATESYAFVLMGQTTALLISKSKIVEGDYEWFVNAIARHTAERRKPGRPDA